MRGTVEDVLALIQRHQAHRINYDSTWQRIQEIIWPFGGDFTRRQWKGERRTDEIFDSTAVWALERFAAFLEALLTPRNQRWHKLRAADVELNEDHEVNAWMDLASRRLFQMRNNPAAQYYSQKHESYKSLGAWGNATLFTDENPTGGCRYRYCHLGRIYIETNHVGLIDTVYHVFPMTARQAIQRWGKTAQLERARRDYEKDPLQECEYVHVVRPRGDEWDPDRVDSLSMEFESIIIEMGERELVEEGGYHEQPYLHSRYTVNPSEMYGRGPGEMVLPDNETLQEQEKTILRSGHMAANPPWLLPDDGPLGRGQRRVNLKPNSLVYGGIDARGNATIQPLQTGAQLPLSLEMQQQKREMIARAFANDLFLLLRDDPEMTATQVLELAKEKGQLLTPTTGRQETESLGPQITREIRIMQRQGLLPPIPPQLEEAGAEFEIVYDNEAARMQRAEDALAIEKATEYALRVGETADPTVLEIPKWHDLYREMCEINGVAARFLNSPEEVRRAIQAQAERKDQRERIELIQGGADAAKAMQEAGVNPGDVAA